MPPAPAPMTTTSTSLANKRAEMRVHARRVGLETGKELEAADGLAYVHVAAIDHRAARASRRLEELGLERHVDDFGNPQGRTQPLFSQGQPGKICHPGRSRVDQPAGIGHGTR